MIIVSWIAIFFNDVIENLLPWYDKRLEKDKDYTGFKLARSNFFFNEKVREKDWIKFFLSGKILFLKIFRSQVKLVNSQSNTNELSISVILYNENKRKKMELILSRLIFENASFKNHNQLLDYIHIQSRFSQRNNIE